MSSSKKASEIKCFSGSYECFFERSLISDAFDANADALLRDPEKRVVLKKFLVFRRGKSFHKLNAEKLIECFELADEIRNGSKVFEVYRKALKDLLFNESLVIFEEISLNLMP